MSLTKNIILKNEIHKRVCVRQKPTAERVESSDEVQK
jgi:hypothetical protein